MSLFSALREIIRPRKAGRKGSRPGSGRIRRPWLLALEFLEDRLCLSGDLLVSSYFTNNVLAFDGTQGTFLQTFTSGGNIGRPVGIALGPNDDVYVSSRDTNTVLHYDGNSGAYLGTFVTPGSGGLNGPHALVFGPDGNLYVNSGYNSSVLRYDRTSGAFLNTFVPSGSGGLSFPHGMTFGPDGNLYVSDVNNNDVLRYNGTTGAFLNAFVPSNNNGGLNRPTGLVFGPDGNLYVDSFNTNSVLRYNGQTGAFLGTFASGNPLDGPQGLTFGPDGNLYVSSFNNNGVLRYNGTTGAYIGVFASGGGLVGPTYLTFRSTHSTTTLIPSGNPVVFGQPASFTAIVNSVTGTGATPTGTVTFSIDGAAQAPVNLSNGQATLTVSTLSVASHTITATYNGQPGFQGSTSAPLNETVNKAGTATAISASAGPSVFGQPVTFTAAVTAVAPGAGTGTGTVTFTIDGTSQTQVVVSNGQASFTTGGLGVGSHQIIAAYNGDGNFNPSQAVLNPTVNKANTTTGLSSSAAPSVFGQSVTFTASVAALTPGAGMPTGTITFSVDGTAQTPVALSNGLATFTTSALGLGGHVITAAYNGDGNFNTSGSATLNQTVNQANTATNLSASGSASVFGQSVTLTATLMAVAPGAGTPTGMVTFTIDGVAQTPVALSNGQASLATSALGVGVHIVTAAYGGDSNFIASNSPGLLQTVNRADTTMVYSSSVDPSVYGQPVTFTVVVNPVAPGAGIPTGTVTFSVDGAAQVPSSVVNGQATFTTSTLSVGDHKIAMVYSGDVNFNTSVLDPIQTVKKADTTTAVSASANPSVFGQPVTFTAVVFVVAPGAGLPAGTVTFSVDGTAQTPVSLNNGQAQFTSAILSVGSHTVVAAYNGNSNFNTSTSAALNQTVNKADTTTTLSVSAAPSVFGQSVTFTAAVAAVAPGAGTPTGTVTFTIDGTAQATMAVNGSQASFTTSALGVGPHAVTAAYGGDGNFNNSTSAGLNQTVNKADTATNLSASAAPSLFGQSVTFTAAVNAVAPGAGVLTGTVTFTVDGATAASVTLSNGQAAFTTSALGVGNHTIVAAYNGDGSFNTSSSAALNQTVNQANTATALSASTGPSVFGQLVTFTAAVAAAAPGTGTPTGTVTFTVDGAAQTPVALSNGQASFGTSALGVGPHIVTAAYNGDGNFNTSMSAGLLQTVNKADTTAAVSVSAAPSVFGQPVTLTAAVSAVAPGAGLPSGTVTFTVDGVAQASVALSNGQAAFVTSALSVGGHTILAAYSGDGSFNTSTSAALNQTVNQADTTTAISASAAPCVFGQPVTFTAAVVPVAPGAGTLTGTVTFTIDGVAQASVALSQGQATLTTSALSVGGHVVGAAYSGDGNFKASTSAALNETVNRAATSTAVSASGSPSVFGQLVTFTAAVAVPVPGAGTPSGTVTFTIDGTAQTPVALSNGQASLATSALGVGAHNVTAAYNGDGNFNASTSGVLNETVNKADTTTAVSASAGPSVFGQSVTFTAAVAAVAPGAGTPTGTVTFAIDGTTQAAVALNNGQASFTTSALGVGPHVVTAAFGGDANFNTSTSSGLLQTVSKANTTTAVSATAPSVFGQPVTLTAAVVAVAPGAGALTGSVTFTIDGVAQPSLPVSNGQATLTTSALNVGSHTVAAAYSGDGNFNGSTSASLNQTVNRADTATAVSASASPSVFGQSVTFTAAVTAVVPGAGTPTGTIAFTIDGTTQPSVALSNGTATVTATALSVGSHTITASYSGDAGHNASASPNFVQTVNPASTTTTITSSAGPAVFGQPVTFTAAVNGGAAGTPSGTVTFTIDGTAQTPVPLTNGQAAVTTSVLSVGSHSIVAAYSGDGSFTASTSGLAETVNKANTTIVVNSSAEPSVFGQPVSFTASVAAVAPGAGSPTGTVTFAVDRTPQAPVTISNGQAVFTIATLGVGSHDISAVYSGDGNFNTSAVDPMQVVDKAKTTTAVSASADPSAFGKPVTFTAQVSVVAPGDGTATGTVTFTIDGTAQAPVSLGNGQATFTTSSLSVGGHSVTATYNGDSNFSSSTSAALNQTVNSVVTNTTTAVSSSASSSVFGQSVTFTAKVTAVAQGAGTPIGTVTFTVDGKAQTPIALSSGQVSFTTSALSVGTHIVTAAYNGDANFNASNSPGLLQTVSKASTTTTVYSSANPSAPGKVVKFTAVVAAVWPGAGTPTGTVTFIVDGRVKATVTLVNGTASFSTERLGAGKHVITVTYNGDGNFTGSKSPALTQTVNRHGHHKPGKGNHEDRDRDDGYKAEDDDHNEDRDSDKVTLQHSHA